MYSVICTAFERKQHSFRFITKSHKKSRWFTKLLCSGKIKGKSSKNIWRVELSLCARVTRKNTTEWTGENSAPQQLPEENTAHGERPGWISPGWASKITASEKEAAVSIDSKVGMSYSNPRNEQLLFQRRCMTQGFWKPQHHGEEQQQPVSTW